LVSESSTPGQLQEVSSQHCRRLEKVSDYPFMIANGSSATLVVEPPSFLSVMRWHRFAPMERTTRRIENDTDCFCDSSRSRSCWQWVAGLRKPRQSRR
jgi:hypothetical protein